MADLDVPDLISSLNLADCTLATQYAPADSVGIHDSRQPLAKDQDLHQLPTTQNSGSEEEEEDENADWNDEDGDQVIEPAPVACFFCSLHDAPEMVLRHCCVTHSCDLVSWVKERRLSTVDIIKMVNFIRKQRPDASVFIGGTVDPGEWSGEENMFPACEGDDGITSLLIWDWNEAEDLAEPFPAPLQSYFSGILSNNENKTDEEQEEEGHDTDKRSLADAEDNARNVSYFDSYSGFNIHAEMLRDKVRTEAYQLAIAETVKERVVLDVGCGSGVLSCFAAAAGAKEVIAVDKADIIDYAHEIAIANGLSDKIRFVHGDLDRVKLPVQKVDVIVSEWMGYFLLFEGMLDSVIAARDKYLKPEGTMIPSWANMYVCGVSDQDDWNHAVGMWDNAYGLKFECLKRHSLRYPNVGDVNREKIVMESSVPLRSFDLTNCSVQETEFETTLTFLPSKTCDITALVGFFDVGYNWNGTQKLMLSTSPSHPITHWGQSVFYLDQVFPVSQGVAVTLLATITKSVRDKRGLRVNYRMSTCHQQQPITWTQSYDL